MDIRQMEVRAERIDRESQMVEEAILSIVLDGRPTSRDELAWIENKLTELRSDSQNFLSTCTALILG